MKLEHLLLLLLLIVRWHASLRALRGAGPGLFLNVTDEQEVVTCGDLKLVLLPRANGPGLGWAARDPVCAAGADADAASAAQKGLEGSMG